MDTIDCLIIGAGVVGLAVARALALAGREVVVVESNSGIGQEISSRNSEVIHAGIYYRHGSQLARFCAAGRRALYDFCASRHVAHSRCGKIIVATDEAEVAALDRIAAHARANGVDDLVFLDRTSLHQLEPALSGVAGLMSPSTGILDSHGYMLALQGEAENAGVLFAFNSPVVGGDVRDGAVVDVGGENPLRLACRCIINTAGLRAPAVARAMRGFPEDHVPPAYYAKGSYFALAGGRAPFSRLIYPVPVPGGLGVHLTLDLAGQARFGPDVEWVEQVDYAVDPSRGDRFYAAIRRYWPDLADGQLVPAYAGIRPKIVPPSIASQDFQILGPRDHGVPGLIHLFGIESPGLTASLALADHVRDLAQTDAA